MFDQLSEGISSLNCLSLVVGRLPVPLWPFSLFVAFRTVAWLILGTGETTDIALYGAGRCVGGDADMMVSLLCGGTLVSRSRGGPSVSRSRGGASVSRSRGGASVSRSGAAALIYRSLGGASVSRSDGGASVFGWRTRLVEQQQNHVCRRRCHRSVICLSSASRSLRFSL